MGGIMLDSTNPNAVLEAIKAGRQWRNMRIRAGAGYVDGPNSQWPSSAFTALRALHVSVVEITVSGVSGADVADIEKGDLSPSSGAAWAADEKKAGRYPVLYVNRSNKPAVITECVARSMSPGHDYWLWVATLDNTFTDAGGADLRTEAGVVAVQFAGAQATGIDADASVITPAGNSWLHLKPTWQEQVLTDLDGARALIKAHL
jgi:hypothetical protein